MSVVHKRSHFEFSTVLKPLKRQDCLNRPLKHLERAVCLALIERSFQFPRNCKCMTTLRSKKTTLSSHMNDITHFLQRVTIHNSSTGTSETLNAYVWSAGVCSAFFGTCLFRRSCSACGKSDQSTGVTSSNRSTGSQLSARPKTPAWPVLWYSKSYLWPSRA